MKLLSNQIELQSEFERCCRDYSEVEIYTAWVGNPGNIVPFSYLENLAKVQVYLGISFDQSHPDGIEYLLNRKYKVQIIDDKSTYHPKLYFFKSEKGYALLMGSSNFTYAGFYQNIEANILLEGKEFQRRIKNYLTEVRQKISALDSFIPDTKWLKEYRKLYKVRQIKLKQAKIKEETIKEDKQIASSSWLGAANWETYLKHIKKGIKRHTVDFEESIDTKISLLHEYKTHLSTPWNVSLFNTIENRRRILGKRSYGWLGHIGASGRVQQLFANGSPSEKRTIVNAVNKISEMKIHGNYIALQRELKKLEELGPSIKVWGRILAVTRPDVFCTIASPFVRESLSELLDKPKSYFETIEGYIELIKLIHNSPWFNAAKPKDKKEQQIWMNRVAFLDVIFY